MKYKNQKTNDYKSQLELYAATQLEEEGIEFGYEPYRITLLPSFRLGTLRSVERSKKKLSETKLVRPMTYSPDFVGSSWIMETKGRRTPDFNLKWKLLKYLLRDTPLTLYMPRSRKDVDECIENIKLNGQNKGIFRIPESLQLYSRDDAKPTTAKAKKRESKTRRRGQKAL